MTSSLKSKFDLSNKRAVCVAADKVTVYHWHHGGLADCFVFDADEAGLAHFARYIEETSEIPVYLLVDVVEEEYRQETVPHVMGRDRRAVIERKQSRLFRGTPYYYHEIQGRETEGRRDDRVLLTALTNPDILAPWLRLFEEFKVPMAGIYSLPLLSKLLLPKLEAPKGDVLLVSLQSASGMRQTFFSDDYLKLSRLAKLPRLGTVPYGPHILGELEKFRRYLNSLRLISRDRPLEIYLLSHGEILESLRAECHDTELVHYHLTDIAQVAQKLGISGVLTTPFSDALFAHLLLAGPPKNHYATPEETNYYQMYRLRIGMTAAGLLLLLCTTVWSGYNFIEGVSLKQQALDAEQKADFYQARFQIARQGLPPTVVEPVQIKTIVDAVDQLERHRATPLPALRALGNVLTSFPALQVDRIEWIVSPDPDARPDAIARTPGAGQPAAASPVPVTRRYQLYEIAVLEGHLEPFDGDYRQAISLVNRFTEALRGANGVEAAHADALPLDVSPATSLSGNTAAAQTGREASFKIRVVLGVGGEAT